MKRPYFLTLTVLAALGIAPLAANAQTVTIIDQSQTFGGIGVLNNPYYSQSFTPTLTSLNFVTLAFDSTQGTAKGTVDILSGAGPNGTVLASSPVTKFNDFHYGVSGPSPSQPTTFLFATPVVLIPGRQYTIRANGPFDSVLMDLSTENYAGGNAYFGQRISSGDFYFVEGLMVPAPEPSQFTAFAIGILGLSALALRARRRSAA